MWSRTHSRKVKGMAAARLWDVWVDVNQWHLWQDDMEYARLGGPFAVGSSFQMRPKGGPEVKITLNRVEPQRCFEDVTRFPGARMFGLHEFVPHGDEIEIRITMRVEGPLGFLWRKLVAEGVVNGLPAQTDALIGRVQALGGSAQ